ncbi:MAG TPA: hypothetical protein VF635_17695 [Propionibacteriaceae bacterium]|jgi:hypothetical protein
MWAFISARLRQWLFFAVALPVLTLLVHVLRQIIEKRSGETRLTRVLAQLEDLGRRGKRKK